MADEVKLKKIVDQIVGLPTLPTVVAHITSMMQNPKTSATDIGTIISRDQALSAKVLKLVNSAFYGFPRRIKTISHAIVVLGFGTVRNVVLSASVFDAFKGTTDGEGFDRKGFWVHSLACGVAAKIISKRLGIKNIEESFIAGILHDIGKIILDQFVKEDFQKIIQIVNEKKCLIYEAEKEVLNFTHEDIGTWLADKWNLPIELVAVIANHHNPLNVKEGGGLAMIVHVADILVRAIELGNGGDKKIPLVIKECWDQSELSLLTLDKVFSEIDEEMEKASVFLALLN